MNKLSKIFNPNPVLSLGLSVLALTGSFALAAEASFRQSGIASWYGPGFQGRLMANGKRFNQYAMTAAHKTLPFGTVVKVINPKTKKSVKVTVTDRGPYVGGRIIDLSKKAGADLGISGIAKVSLVVISQPKNLKKN
jgi:rare lipoprotein A